MKEGRVEGTEERRKFFKEGLYSRFFERPKPNNLYKRSS